MIVTAPAKASEVLREMPRDQWTMWAYGMDGIAIRPDPTTGNATVVRTDGPTACATGYLGQSLGLHAGFLGNQRIIAGAYGMTPADLKQVEVLNDHDGLDAAIAWLQERGL